MRGRHPSVDDGQQRGPCEGRPESAWPSGAVYTNVHNSPEWKAVVDKHPGLDGLMSDEIYNRYIEVMPQKR